MKINGLVVCVNYSEFLKQGFDRWLEGLDSLTVVTTPDDKDTIDLVTFHPLRRKIHLADTNLFYADGASFNKGRAMEWARRTIMPWTDWILFFDADVIPPRGWYNQLKEVQPGYLYSAWRYQCDDVSQIDTPNLPHCPGDVIGVGYFQLFHSQDQVVRGRVPLIDTWWLHAGNYDNRLMSRWMSSRRRALSFDLAHIGPRDNWWGRGKKVEFDKMQAERKRRGGRWDHERIPGVPID